MQLRTCWGFDLPLLKGRDEVLPLFTISQRSFQTETKFNFRRIEEKLVERSADRLKSKPNRGPLKLFEGFEPIGTTDRAEFSE